MSRAPDSVLDHPTAIAVVGIAGRFPGADSVEAFWRNLAGGRESISFFTDDDLRAEGLDPARVRRPGYVSARGALDDPAGFDAAFFGITPGEAVLLDPQQRLFLECAWAALEDAALDPARFGGSVGVYGGVSLSTYHARVLAAPGVDAFAAGMGNDKDFLATRVAFKLDLRGPAVVVQSACSTSLVAVHLACQALLSAECDVALAGGASVAVPHRAGYVHQEGGILSPDGHCRAFDARAAGTVPGSGAGVVVLKRLADALADGDPVRAVIRGSALNNDGGGKVGYTTPSVDGQARVIAEALGVAGVDPATIGYVEAHGTATEIGDPTEVAALARALGGGAEKRCAIGSVKTNLGHLDAAAGVAGLVKAVLALEHRQIPPSLHLETPSPRIDFARTPLFVADRLIDWASGDAPRRAGVSSFGIGGTNAHVVLEEAPELPPSGPSRPWQLLTLSARSPAALERAGERLAAHLHEHPEQPLADVAFTLHAGRRAFAQRAAVAARTGAEAADALESGRWATGAAPAAGERGVVFLFPGQGAQHPGMGRGLYAAEPAYRREVDRCAEILHPHLGFDLRDLLHADRGDAEAAARLEQTAVTQPALFVVEYALARAWEAWGVRPAAMLGHSIGEYVAACLAGVFSLEDALAVVAARGALMQAQPPGAMLAVPLPEADLAELLEGDVALASVNAPAACVASGPAEAVEALERHLEARGVSSRRLHTSHAFHSAMMEPALAPFREAVARARLSPPRIPFVSNLTGTWITDAEAADPDYWTRHLRGTVRFGAGAAELLRDGSRAYLEVGPGRTLTTLLRRQAPTAPAAASLAAPKDGAEDLATMLEAAGRLWTAGAAIDLARLWAGEQRRRVRLPTYPFERVRHWIELPARPEPPANARETAAEAPSASPVATPSTSQAAPVMRTPARRDRIARQLQETFGRVLGIGADAVEPDTLFLELGADSLLLLQASRAIEERFGAAVPFRAFMESLSTVDALAAHLDESLPPEVFAETGDEGRAMVDASAPAAEPPIDAAPPMALALTPPISAATIDPSVGASAVERLLAQQLQVMREVMAGQLDVLRGASVPRDASPHAGNGASAVSPSPVQTATPAPARIESPSPSHPTAAGSPSPDAGAVDARKPFGPHRPHQAEALAGETLTPRQRAHLDALIERYTARTRESKRRAAEERAQVADPRAAVGFRMLWKELVYPIVGERSEGSRLWDVDGNEYVDFTMGFGVHLFGHSPPFVTRAIQAQLARGMQLGPQSDLAGGVAARFLEMTGHERVAFCNTGTEAVMSALRMARAVTGRSTVALFAGSYHGHSDGVLARPRMVDEVPRAIPVAPGILQHMVDDLLVLEYGDPASLEVIRAHAGDLAAVLVEPMQSRRPDFFPADYLRELREITRRAGVPLVFDEVISGFRLHPAGAQGLLGIRADLATYGKVIGGGLPIGAIAGEARFLDAIDGGGWSYGDDSYPRAGQTLFAGTFSKNPLTMAAADASLQHLQQAGPALQEGLTRRTEELAARLDALFEREGAPLRVIHGGSTFRLAWAAEARHMELLYFHLVERGIYVWEGRGCFVSTAHTDADFDRLADAVADSVAALREGGFIPETGARPSPNGSSSSSTAASSNGSSAGSETHTALAASPSANGDGVRTLPPTAAQRQLWVHTQVGPEASLAYNEILSLRLRGPLDADALGRAVQSLVDRHEALRTTFSPDGEAQLVHPRVTVPLHLADAVPGTDAEETVAAVLDAELHHPFDLAAGPLVRARLVRLGEDDHFFVLAVHHLAADGFSMGILDRDLRALYAAEARGAAPALPPAMQFGEYAAKVAEAEAGPDFAAAEAFWRGEMEGAVPLELPSERPPSRTGEHGGARETLTLGPEDAAAVRRLGARAGSTPFMTLAAAFLALLHRVTGQDDVLVGTPSLGRTFQGDETLVGHCVDLLPVRSRLAGDPSFAGHLASTRAWLLGALQHRVFSLGYWGLGRAGRVPPVTVTFNYEPPAATGEGASGGTSTGLRAEPVAAPVRRAKFDLGVDVAERGGALHLSCIYDSHRFDAEWVRALLERFRLLLSAAAENPERRLSDLPLLLPTERDLVLTGWNDAARDYPLHRPLHRFIEDQAARTPDAAAVTFEGKSIAYDELNARANRLARHLQARGVGPETRVGVLMDRSAELVVALLAILKAGGAYVPLDPGYPAERLTYMLADARVAVLVADDRLAGALPWSGETVRPDAPGDRDRIVTESDANLDVEPAPEGLAYVIYTSGSTGRPKGAMNTHAGIVNRLLWMQEAFGLGAGDAVLQKTPVSFDVSVWEFFWSLMAGARLVVARPGGHRDPGYLAGVIEAERVTTLHFVPSMLEPFLEEPHVGARCRSVRRVVCSGEALSPALAARFAERMEAELHNLYGPTEAAVDVTHWPCGRESDGRSVPIGRPIANTRMYVLDGRFHPVPPGSPGELCIGGVNVGRGYLGASALTAERFVPDPFSGEPGARLYRTGDRGRHRADGALEFLGRLDDQVKVRGFRVEPGEVEAALGAHPAVRQAAVAARGSGDAARLVAWIVPAAAPAPGEDELRRFLRARLPEHMVPSAIVATDALPLTPSGKVDRRALPDPASPRAASSAPPEGLEVVVAAAWHEVLGIDTVGVDDNFFDCGGTSLLLVRLANRLRPLAGGELTVTELFAHPTIRSQAVRLSRGDGPLAAPAARDERLTEGAGRLAALRGAAQRPAAP